MIATGLWLIVESPLYVNTCNIDNHFTVTSSTQRKSTKENDILQVKDHWLLEASDVVAHTTSSNLFLVRLFQYCCCSLSLLFKGLLGIARVHVFCLVVELFCVFLVLLSFSLALAVEKGKVRKPFWRYTACNLSSLFSLNWSKWRCYKVLGLMQWIKSWV